MRIAVALVPVLVLTALSGAADAPVGPTFPDPKGEFSVATPDGWKQGKVEDGLLVLGPPPTGTRAYPMFQAVRGARRDPASPPGNAPAGALDMLAQAFADSIAKKGVAEPTITKTRLDGVEARQIKFTMPVKERPVSFDYVLAVRNDQVYWAHFMQEQAHYDAAACQSIMSSFRWTSK